jgi:hypothetical protein
MSLESQLLGMFSNSSKPKVNDLKTPLLWIPPSVSESDVTDKSVKKFHNIRKSAALPSKSIFPLQVQSESENTLFLSDSICPKLVAKFKKINQEKTKEYIKIFAPTIQLLNEKGFDTKTLFEGDIDISKLVKISSYNVSRLYSDPQAKIDYNFRLHFEIMASMFYTTLLDNPSIIEASLYQMLAKITENLRAYENKEEYKKLMMFSGHDDNIDLLVLKLLNKKNVECTLNNYKKILLKSKIESKDDYFMVLEQMKKDNCHPLTPYASNVIFEVFTGKF